MAQAVAKITKAAAVKALAEINSHYEDNAAGTANLAMLVDAFFSAELHHHLDCPTIASAEADLFPFGQNRVRTLRLLGQYSRELRYTVNQLAHMVGHTHSYGRLIEYLRDLDVKEDIRSVVANCNSEQRGGGEQFNVHLTPSETKLCNRVLTELGMVPGDRRENVTYAFNEMVKLAAAKLKIPY